MPTKRICGNHPLSSYVTWCPNMFHTSSFNFCNLNNVQNNWKGSVGNIIFHIATFSIQQDTLQQGWQVSGQFPHAFLWSMRASLVFPSTSMPLPLSCLYFCDLYAQVASVLPISLRVYIFFVFHCTNRFSPFKFDCNLKFRYV